MSAILRKNWKTMISDDVKLMKAFPEPPMVCFTRGKNLREEVCQAKLPPSGWPDLWRMVSRGVVEVTADFAPTPTSDLAR